MERRLFRLVHDQARANAIMCVRNAPEGYVVSVGEETRTQMQNRLMWPLLTDLSKCDYYGRPIKQHDWKNLCMGGLASAEFVPSLDGKSVMPLGLSTSNLTKSKFSELIEFIYYTGAQRGVTFRTDEFV